MNHQCEVEKNKYRNWVRGALAYKYLKQGLEGFAGEVVELEHEKIIQTVCTAPGSMCSSCCLKDLKPLHTCKKEYTGRNKCPLDQPNCNCLHRQKQACPSKFCDSVMEEILRCHGSSPPAPNWSNTDIRKWCSHPWEIAKCYINARGYSNKTNAADIDISGLLHIFINNLNILSYFSNDLAHGILTKIRDRRNDICHSANMEMESIDLDECIDDIIKLLEDKLLKERKDVKEAVMKLEQLKRDDFIITTKSEVDVCTDALESIAGKAEEVKQIIAHTEQDIAEEQASTVDDTNDETEHAEVTALKKENDIQSLKQMIDSLNRRIASLEGDNTVFKQDTSKLKERLVAVENRVYNLEAAKERCEKRLKFAHEKQALQDGLVKLYQHHYTKTSICPLKCNEDDIHIDEVYIEPKMEIRTKLITTEANRRQSGSYKANRCHRYDDIFYTEKRRNNSIFILGDVGSGKSSFCKMMIHTWCTAVTGEPNISAKGSITNKTVSNDVTQSTDENLSSKVSPSADQSFSSDKIEFAVKTLSNDTTEVHDGTHFDDKTTTSYEGHFDDNIIGAYERISDPKVAKVSEDTVRDSNKPVLMDENSKPRVERIHEKDMNEMRKFNFLFYIPLQKMTGFNDITDMIKAITRSANLASDELINEIFRQESSSCLILADGLDEWIPPKNIFLPPHVSDGLPVREKAEHAIVLTLTRSSAKGMLNMKSSECDQRVDILGIYDESVHSFVSNYMKKYNKPELSLEEFMKKLRDAKLKDLEKTPLFLLQYLWLYRSRNEFGRTINETYSHLINTMLGWLQNKDGEYPELCHSDRACEEIELPRTLLKFPRCDANKKILLSLARSAFEAICADIGVCTFSRLHLHKNGLTKNDISRLIKLGILVEENCLDPTEERTKLGFVHIAYFEYFASVYISSHCREEDVAVNPNSRKRLVSALETLLTKCKSAADVIQISRILKVTCEIFPFIIKDLSILISNIVNKDEGIGRFRRFLPDSGIADSEPESFKIQRFVFDDLLEKDSVIKKNISLSDVFISNGEEFSCLDRIINESVSFLFIENYDKKETWERILMLTRLQFIHISHCILTNKAMESLVSVLETIPLVCISLYFVQSSCEKQYIDASNNDKLQSLDIRHCDSLEFSAITPSNLLTVRFDSYNVLNVNLLQNAGSLTHLHIGEFHSLSFQYSGIVNDVVNTLTGLKRLCLEYADINDNAFTLSTRMISLELIEFRNVDMSNDTWLTFTESLLKLEQLVHVCMLDCSAYGRNYVLLKEDMFEVITDDALSFRFRKRTHLNS